MRFWGSCHMNYMVQCSFGSATAVVVPLLINPHSGKPLDSANWSQQIHIFNKTVGGNFEAIQILDVDYQPGFTAIHNDVMVVGSNWEMLETGAVMRTKEIPRDFGI